MTIPGLILFLCIGLILGLIGGGGSLLGVPVLVYVMHVVPELATTYSLFIVGVTALVGAISYLRKGEISAEAILNFAIASIISIFCMRKFIMPAIPLQFQFMGIELHKHTVIMVMFALIMMCASYSMIKKQIPNRINDTKWDEFSRSPMGIPFVIMLGIGVGVITGFVGAGGGFIIVPVLLFFVRLNFKKAIGTSLCIVAINSLVGFAGNIGQQNIDWKFLLIISSVCGIGILLGSLASNKISSKKLKPAFGWFTLAVGIFVLIKEVILK
jgi:uncharacterized membrane protein YfcA